MMTELTERDVRITEPNPEAPEWARSYAVWVDGRIGGFCRTLEKAEQAAEHERSRDAYPEERAAELLREHFAGRDGIKYVGVENTGGGCIVGAVYTEAGPYVWISDARESDGEEAPGYFLGAYRGSEELEGQPEDWAEEHSILRIPAAYESALGAMAEAALEALSAEGRL